MMFRVVLLLITLAPLSRAQSGGWLDSRPVQWNRPGSALPTAPQLDRDEIPEICRNEPRKPETPAERAVVSAGWMFIVSNRSADREVILGAADLDGMCRPNQYQEFVFIAGKYAGTLSPKLMDSRTDGSIGRVSFRGPNIVVEFDRYRPEDPFCCPSRISEAVFAVRTFHGNPVVAHLTVNTRDPH